MNWPTPAPADFWKAVEIYLSTVYDGTPPLSVRNRLDTLRAVPEDGLFASSVFEPMPKEQPTRLGVRLGNRWYPHMKLVIEQSPGGAASLFRADTHDRHIHIDPSSREYPAFCDMMAKNQSLAGKIEAAWEAGGLPTFKSFLREDLARRQTRPTSG